MKLCDSDSPNDHLFFLQQFVFLREFREAFTGHPQLFRFPDVIGSGAFNQLCYKDVRIFDSLCIVFQNSNEDEAAKLLMLFPRPHPRPYLIFKKQGPTIEDVMRANQFGVLDVSTARFVAIGCIQVGKFVV